MLRDEQYRLLWSGISTSRKIRCVSGDKWFRIGCHLVFTWMVAWGDDDGRLRGEPLWILANVLPNEGLSVDEIGTILFELGKVGLIQWYEVDGEKFVQIVDNKERQRIRKDRYNPSIYPSCNGNSTICQPLDGQTADKPPQTRDPLLTQSLSQTVSLSLPRAPRKKRDAIEHPLFQKFWSAYPKKRSKGQAEKAFNSINPDEQLVDKMLSTIERAKKSVDWMKEKGKFIPHPATWLNAKGWEDEETEDPAPGVSEKTRQTIEAGKRWLEKHEGSQAIPGEHGDAQ
jgi:hypothetical protein